MYNKITPSGNRSGYLENYDPSFLTPTNIWLGSEIPATKNNSSKSNWISALLRKHVEDASQVTEIDKNNLTVVTFNYDTIIQDSLSSFIKKTPKFKEHAAGIISKVLHVYGAFKPLVDRPHSNFILECAKGISYIHDTNVKERESLKEIKNEISEAECIFIIGFDAAKQNCGLIDLNKSLAHKFALNYDGNSGLDSRLRNVGLLDKNIMKGSSSSPLSLPQACTREFFHQGDSLKTPVNLLIAREANSNV